MNTMMNTTSLKEFSVWDRPTPRRKTKFSREKITPKCSRQRLRNALAFHREPGHWGHLWSFLCSAIIQYFCGVWTPTGFVVIMWKQYIWTLLAQISILSWRWEDCPFRAYIASTHNSCSAREEAELNSKVNSSSKVLVMDSISYNDMKQELSSCNLLQSPLEGILQKCLSLQRGAFVGWFVGCPPANSCGHQGYVNAHPRMSAGNFARRSCTQELPHDHGQCVFCLLKA